MVADVRPRSDVEGALDLMSTLVLEDGRRWGEAALPWQWFDAEANLDPASPTPYSFQTRPRGGSKTADQAGALLSVMLTQAPPGARLYALAADRDQGALLIDSIRGYVDRTPALQGAVEISTYRVSIPGSGVRLDVLAADAPGSWGLRPYYIAIDELAQWSETPSTRQLYEAVVSSAAKLGARMVITTTAGDPAHFAHAVLEHALSDPLWRVHEVPGPLPWLDSRRLEEQRRALPESSFRRLHLNQWATAEDRLATLDDIRACVRQDGDLRPRPGVDYVIGVDIGIVNDRTALATCHREPSPRSDRGAFRACIVVDQIATWYGSRAAPVPLDQVRHVLLDTVREFNHAKVVVDPYQAALLSEDLRRQGGVRVEEYGFSQASAGKLAAALHVLIRNRSLDLPNDPRLVDELSRVRLRETSPGSLRLDHAYGQHDDRAIAIGLAALDLLARDPNEGPRARWLTRGPSPPRSSLRRSR